MITKVLFFIVQVKYHYKNLRCKINSFEFEIVKNFARIRKLTTWSLNRFSQISSCVCLRTSVLYFSNWFNLFFLKLICVIHVHIYEIGAFQLYLFYSTFFILTQKCLNINVTLNLRHRNCCTGHIMNPRY